MLVHEQGNSAHGPCNLHASTNGERFVSSDKVSQNKSERTEQFYHQLLLLFNFKINELELVKFTSFKSPGRKKIWTGQERPPPRHGKYIMYQSDEQLQHNANRFTLFDMRLSFLFASTQRTFEYIYIYTYIFSCAFGRCLFCRRKKIIWNVAHQRDGC